MVTAESLVITAILIAPGFVAVLIGVTLGVVEREIGRDEFYLSSLISSLLIGVVFIWFIQIQWAYQITHPAELTDIFSGNKSLMSLPRSL